MNNEERLLRLYYAPYARREVLQQPFLQDGKVCATDGHVLIRIDAAMCDGDYQEEPKGLKPPRTAHVIPEADTDEPLTYRMLERALKKAPEEESRQCPECKGEGEVEWEYRDRLYNYHHHLDTCPECEGTGEISEYTAVKYHFTLHGCALCYRHIKLLMRTMECLQTDTLQLRHAKQPQAVLITTPGIEIIIMPQLRDTKLEEVKIK